LINESLLKIDGLRLALNSTERGPRIVDGLDLEISQGETFALLGESGCGKSMTALSLMRLLPPSVTIEAGGIYFNSIDIVNLDQRSMRQLRGGQLGMIFQEPMSSLNPLMPIGRQIAEAVKLHQRRRGNEINRQVIELLHAVAIPDPAACAARYPHQLSGGMKQRAVIAMALAGNPRLLIADEPTTALDVTIQAQILNLLKQLQQERGMSILLITHDLGVVARMADRVAVMYAGQLVESAVVESFFRSPGHPYSRLLFEALPERRRRGEKLAAIEGSVPVLGSSFSGCRFLPRCAQGLQHCRDSIPDWRMDENGSRVRCYLFGEHAPPEGGSGVTAPSAYPSGDSIGEPLLSVHSLQVRYPIKKGILRRGTAYLKAVDGVDLAIAKGAALALLGESGCGKSTVGKAILQLVDISGGKVSFEGRELTTMKRGELHSIRGDLQIIFQDPMSAMNPRMRVGDIIAEGMRAQGVHHRKTLTEAVESLLSQVGLPVSAAGRYPHEFSGGQRQRICIARALAVEPRVLICDEPTSALDLSVQAQILNLLKQLQAEFQLAYLFISHDISVVAYMADEIAVMYLGRIVEQGTTDEVMKWPMHPYTQALLSAVPTPEPGKRSSMIRLPGEIPSALNPPSGCHFHPRCPRIEARCESVYPEVFQVTQSHNVRCWRARAC
jgi:peptide/nickel transport system ATP-binding protein